MGPFQNEGFQLTYPFGAGDTYFPEAIKFTFVKRLGVNFDKALGHLEDDKFAGGSLRPQNTGNQVNIVNGNLVLSAIEDITQGESPARIKEIIAKGERLYKENASGQSMPESTKENQEQSIIRRTFKKGMAALSSIRTQNAQLETLGSVYLNMPNNITFSEEVGWGGESLGVVGALTKNALKAGGSVGAGTAVLGGVAGHAGNILSAAAGGLAGKILSKIPGVSGWAGGLIGMMAGEVIQKGGEAAFSVKQNPYMEMMFSGIGFRSFKFDFVFRARNKSEINMVGKIIKMFRQHSRPTWVEGSLGKAFMKYPQEYKIQFLTDIKGNYIDNLHLPQLKPCVCSNVETNFTPDNIWSAYEDGAPVSITLGLTFQEKELVMADDVMREWPDGEAPEGRSEGGSSEFTYGKSMPMAKKIANTFPTGSNQ